MAHFTVAVHEIDTTWVQITAATPEEAKEIAAKVVWFNHRVRQHPQVANAFSSPTTEFKAKVTFTGPDDREWLVPLSPMAAEWRQIKLEPARRAARGREVDLLR